VGTHQTPVVAPLVELLGSLALTPITGERSSRGVIQCRFRLGRADLAVVDARTIDRASGLEFAVAVGGVAHSLPADARQRDLIRAVLESGIDAVSL